MTLTSPRPGQLFILLPPFKRAISHSNYFCSLVHSAAFLTYTDSNHFFCLECTSYPSLRALPLPCSSMLITSYPRGHSLSCHLFHDVPSKEKKKSPFFKLPWYFFLTFLMAPKTLPHMAANCVPHLSVNSSMAVSEFHPVCIFYSAFDGGGIC